jgi:hypothetical protein
MRFLEDVFSSPPPFFFWWCSVLFFWWCKKESILTGQMSLINHYCPGSLHCIWDGMLYSQLCSTCFDEVLMQDELTKLSRMPVQGVATCLYGRCLEQCCNISHLTSLLLLLLTFVYSSNWHLYLVCFSDTWLQRGHGSNCMYIFILN